MNTSTFAADRPRIESSSPLWEKRLPVALLAYFGLHLILRLIISNTLTLDEAEQVMLSQSLQWGYSGQPPLYVWLQQAVFFVLGKNLFSLALLKNGLLFSAYLFFLLSARELWPERPGLRILAVLSWLFIPQIVWEAQRDLSHSVLVLTIASASVYLVARALGRREADGPPGTGWYLAYGLVMAIGLLSKYNFVVFAGALNLALLILPEGRAILLRPRVILSVATVVLASAPHFVWVASHWGLATRSLTKVEAGVGNNRFLGFGVLLLAGLSFLTPLWLLWLGLFPGLFKKLKTRASNSIARFIDVYLMVLLVGSAAGVLLFGVEHVKERWMIPLLFVAPLFFFSRAGDVDLDRRRVGWYFRMALIVAVGILLAAGTRSLLGPTLGATTRVNFPFDQVAEAISTRNLELAPDVILTHNTWFAGNLLKRLPGSRAFVPGFILPSPPEPSSLFVVWDATKSETIPEELREEARNRFGVDPADRSPEVLTLPYKFGAGRQAKVALLKLERPRAQETDPGGSGGVR